MFLCLLSITLAARVLEVLSPARAWPWDRHIVLRSRLYELVTAVPMGHVSAISAHQAKHKRQHDKSAKVPAKPNAKTCDPHRPGSGREVRSGVAPVSTELRAVCSNVYARTVLNLSQTDTLRRFRPSLYVLWRAACGGARGTSRLRSHYRAVTLSACVTVYDDSLSPL